MPKEQAPIVTNHTLREDQDRRKLRVLVAEDNTVNQMVATKMLEKMGYRADVAGNGREAVEAQERLPYDVILMDCQMPELDGFEATKLIREHERLSGERHVPIIALTANAMKGDRDRCIEASMDDYVAKPIKRDELSAAIGRCLGLSQESTG